MSSIKWWAAALGFTFLVPTSLSNAKELQNLVCREDEVILVLPQTMKSSAYRSTSLYKFTSKGLLLSSADRAEYFYNSVQYIEPGRFISGHKTFIFEPGSLSKAIAVHAHETEIRISKLSCTCKSWISM